MSRIYPSLTSIEFLGGKEMAHIENYEHAPTTTLHSPGYEFDGYAKHPGKEHSRLHHAQHGSHLHMGNAFEHASPSQNSHCFGPCEKAQGWHPAQNNHGSQAEEWRKEFEEQSHKPLSFDKDGQYQVQPGDAMGSIVRRALHDEGFAKPTSKQLKQMRKEILDASEKDNPTLKCNPELIRPGMKLTVPALKPENDWSNEPKPGPQTGKVGPETVVTAAPDHQSGKKTPDTAVASAPDHQPGITKPETAVASAPDHHSGKTKPDTAGAATPNPFGAVVPEGHGHNPVVEYTLPNDQNDGAGSPAAKAAPEKPADHWYNLHNIYDRLLETFEALS
jgi:hypothetical protein